VSDGWYWGVTIRVTAADPLLVSLQAAAPTGVRVQHPGSGHLTLFYAPLRGRQACKSLAAAVRDVAAETAPFPVTLRGLGEFATPDRVVAWLGVSDGAASVAALRSALCGCDHDMLPYGFVPHLTLLYASPPAAYEPFRSVVRDTVEQAAPTITVTELWIAGFRAEGHPAVDLEHRVRVPLGT
jgi:2'-5' RNA ligase